MTDHAKCQAPTVMACPHAVQNPRKRGIVWFSTEDEHGKYFQAICRKCRRLIARSPNKQIWPNPVILCAECLLGPDWADYLIDVNPRKGANS